MTRLYFAYGANLHLDGMARRCEAARPVDGDPRGRLLNWRLTFRGVADIEPSLGDHVPGVVWNLTASCEAALDRFEGVAGGFYRKASCDVLMADGRTVQALVYVMCPSPLDNRSMPSQYYLDSIISGYESFGLDVQILRTAVNETWRRVKGKGVTDFRPRGKKRMVPADTKPRKKNRRAGTPTTPRASATTTRSGHALPDTTGMSPATRALHEADRREADRRRRARANAVALAVLQEDQLELAGLDPVEVRCPACDGPHTWEDCDLGDDGLEALIAEYNESAAQEVG